MLGSEVCKNWTITSHNGTCKCIFCLVASACLNVFCFFTQINDDDIRLVIFQQKLFRRKQNGILPYKLPKCWKHVSLTETVKLFKQNHSICLLHFAARMEYLAGRSTDDRWILGSAYSSCDESSRARFYRSFLLTFWQSLLAIAFAENPRKLSFQSSHFITLQFNLTFPDITCTVWYVTVWGS